jgi:U3 small nucleolar RNA-associated protein 7
VNIHVCTFQGLEDKKLKGQLAHRENLFGKSAKAAAKYEKVN